VPTRLQAHAGKHGVLHSVLEYQVCAVSVLACISLHYPASVDVFPCDSGTDSPHRSSASDERDSTVTFAPIPMNSEAIKVVRDLIARVSPTNAPVLILGETGTGKELVARAIHRGSPRSAKPFIALNCAALPPTLLESELFGHKRGAFTGAERSRAGLFEAAHEGTLFLDEVGEMPLEAQAKLLRVLTDGQVTRIGSTKPRQADVQSDCRDVQCAFRFCYSLPFSSQEAPLCDE